MGDGLILTFDTVTDAVKCCIKLQETSKQINDLNLLQLGQLAAGGDGIDGDPVIPLCRVCVCLSRVCAGGVGRWWSSEPGKQ